MNKRLLMRDMALRASMALGLYEPERIAAWRGVSGMGWTGGGSWQQPGVTVRDLDGVDNNEQTVGANLKWAFANPGPDGVCCWFRAYVGNYDVPTPGRLEPWMLEPIRRGAFPG